MVSNTFYKVSITLIPISDIQQILKGKLPRQSHTKTQLEHAMKKYEQNKSIIIKKYNMWWQYWAYSHWTIIQSNDRTISLMIVYCQKVVYSKSHSILIKQPIWNTIAGWEEKPRDHNSWCRKYIWKILKTHKWLRIFLKYRNAL